MRIALVTLFYTLGLIASGARRPQAREEVNQSGKQKWAGLELSRQWAE
jgi:hypothetical protein